MEIHVSQQAGVFLWMALAGMCSSLVYDMFRISRKLFDMPDFAVFICDSVFWAVSAAISFITVLYSNSGELRWFVFAGFLIGGVVYFACVSAVVSTIVLFLLKTAVRIYLFFAKIVSRIARLVLKPVKPVAGRCRKCFRAVRSGIRTRIGIIKKINRKHTSKASH